MHFASDTFGDGDGPRRFFHEFAGGDDVGGASRVVGQVEGGTREVTAGVAPEVFLFVVVTEGIGQGCLESLPAVVRGVEILGFIVVGRLAGWGVGRGCVGRLAGGRVMLSSARAG